MLRQILLKLPCAWASPKSTTIKITAALGMFRKLLQNFSALELWNFRWQSSNPPETLGGLQWPLTAHPFEHFRNATNDKLSKRNCETGSFLVSVAFHGITPLQKPIWVTFLRVTLRLRPLWMSTFLYDCILGVMIIIIDSSQPSGVFSSLIFCCTRAMRQCPFAQGGTLKLPLVSNDLDH